MSESHVPPYPVIDTDPRFTRVIKYFRTTDILGGLGLAALGPATIYWFERYQPTGNAGAPLNRAMKAAGGFGLIAGFLYAYTQSSLIFPAFHLFSVCFILIFLKHKSKSIVRFLGYKPNVREIKMFRKEYYDLKAQGKTMEGYTTLTPDLQSVAARYSTNSVFNIAVLPWFNFVSHPYHGQSEGVIPKEDL